MEAETVNLKEIPILCGLLNRKKTRFFAIDFFATNRLPDFSHEISEQCCYLEI